MRQYTISDETKESLHKEYLDLVSKVHTILEDAGQLMLNVDGPLDDTQLSNLVAGYNREMYEVHDMLMVTGRKLEAAYVDDDQ